MDAPAFRFWARLMHRQPDHHFEDAMIAATADRRGLTVATRNIRDYKRFGVKTFDPFSPRA
jgi:predicted nucleic acid-binding protein